MQAVRAAIARLVLRVGGADHRQMERIKVQVARLCRGWPAGWVAVIVSTPGQEMVGPIGASLGASGTIATRMRLADGCYWRA